MGYVIAGLCAAVFLAWYLGEAHRAAKDAEQLREKVLKCFSESVELWKNFRGPAAIAKGVDAAEFASLDAVNPALWHELFGWVGMLLEVNEQHSEAATYYREARIASWGGHKAFGDRANRRPLYPNEVADYVVRESTCLSRCGHWSIAVERINSVLDGFMARPNGRFGMSGEAVRRLTLNRFVAQLHLPTESRDIKRLEADRDYLANYASHARCKKIVKLAIEFLAGSDIARREIIGEWMAHDLEMTSTFLNVAKMIQSEAG